MSEPVSEETLEEVRKWAAYNRAQHERQINEGFHHEYRLRSEPHSRVFHADVENALANVRNNALEEAAKLVETPPLESDDPEIEPYWYTKGDERRAKDFAAGIRALKTTLGTMGENSEQIKAKS